RNSTDHSQPSANAPANPGAQVLLRHLLKIQISRRPIACELDRAQDRREEHNLFRALAPAFPRFGT
ncbi:MAG TPA: hypothetical protein VN933_07950, partial [Candidatus Eremiobacteraceae bacterium]|nr:hypothetical protein [Candidatus Eremiobacteraceae bacterium]